MNNFFLEKKKKNYKNHLLLHKSGEEISQIEKTILRKKERRKDFLLLWTRSTEFEFIQSIFNRLIGQLEDLAEENEGEQGRW